MDYLSNIMTWESFLFIIIMVTMIIAITIGLNFLLAKRAGLRIDNLQGLCDEIESLNLSVLLEKLHDLSQKKPLLMTPTLELQQAYREAQKSRENCLELLNNAEDLYCDRKYKKANTVLEESYDMFDEYDSKSRSLFKSLNDYLIHSNEDFKETEGEYYAEKEPLQALYKYDAMEETTRLMNKDEIEYEKSKQDRAIISKNCVIDGNLEVSGDLEIYGKVNGNVTCQGYLKIDNAEISGDIASEKIDIQQSNITGNLAAQDIHVFQGTKINGDVTINVLMNQGNIEGKIDAKEFVSMSADGTIIGDVTTSDIEIARGAVLLGKLTMNQK